MQVFPKKLCSVQICIKIITYDPLEVYGVFICRETSLSLYFLFLFLIYCCVRDVSGPTLGSGVSAPASKSSTRFRLYKHIATRLQYTTAESQAAERMKPNSHKIWHCSNFLQGCGGVGVFILL